MRRQLGVGLLTKIATNGRSSNVVSPSLKPNSTPFLQRSFSTLPRSHLWKICAPSGVIQNGSSLLATTRFFSKALLHNLPTKIPLTVRHTTSVRSFNSLDRRRRSIFRRFTTDEVVLGLIVTNVAVYLLWKVADGVFMVKNFVITVHHIKDHRLHTLVTNAFSHRSQIDLITNILGLYFFGTNIGRSFGPKYLVKLYLCGAVVGSIFFVVYQAFLAPPLQGKMKGTKNSIIPTMGAGGAVNAIMLLDVLLFPSKNILLLGGFIGGLEIWRLLKGDPRVSTSTHLGGVTVAAFAWLIDRKRRFRRL